MVMGSRRMVGIVWCDVGRYECINLWFTQIWSRYHFIMGTDGSGYLRTSAGMISGKVVRKPASIATHSVDNTSDPMVAWVKYTRWLIVV